MRRSPTKNNSTSSAALAAREANEFVLPNHDLIDQSALAQVD